MRSLTSPRNLGAGVGESVFIALTSWFSSLKSPEPPFESPGDEILIKQTHQFKPGFSFLEIQLAPQKSSFSGSTVGDIMFQKFDFSMNVFIAGSYALQHSLLKQLLNKPMIALIKDSNCSANMWYQVGSSCFPAYLRHDFGTGTTKEGVKGYNTVITASRAAVIIYEGGILLQPSPGYTYIATEEDSNQYIADEQGNMLSPEANSIFF